ncbi:MAG TPA: hypothetical protein VFH78_12345, partial [Candidatus Thermoplasmatota archaeon]|nr:hypothetical protein [Candidatus Thermoplasmatota archaeon]
MALALLLALPVSFAGAFSTLDPKPELRADKLSPVGESDVAAASSDCPDASAPATIVAGEPVMGTDPNGNAAPDCNYRLAVSGATGMRLRVNLTTTVDHDPYAKFGSAATTSPYDCSSAATAATFDQCIIDWPLLDGDYYLRVQRWGSTASPFTLTAFVEPTVSTCVSDGFSIVPLSSGTNATGTVSTAANAKCVFAWTPGSFDAGTFSLTPTSGANVDVYVRKNGVPTTSNFDCRSILTGTTTTDACTVAGLTASDVVYVMAVRPASGTSNAGFTLRVDGLNGCSNGSTPVPLSTGVNATGTLATFSGASCLFTWPASGFDAALLNLTPQAGSANVDLYVRKNSAPTTTTYDCRSIISTNTSTDSCTLSGLTASDTLFVMALRPLAGTASASFNLRAEGLQSCSFGAAVTPLDDSVATVGSLAPIAGASCLFSFVPSPTQDSVSVVLNLTTSDFDLYVRKNALPTTTLYDCRPFTSGLVNESCILPNDGSPVFAMVRRFSATGTTAGFAITAKAFSPCSFGNSDQVLTEGVAATAALTDDAGAACYFKFEAAAGFDAAKVTLAPSSGNFDLYLRVGARPTTTTFTCSSVLSGTAVDSCTVQGDAGSVYAMVRRTSGSGSFAITAESTSTCSLGPGVHALPAGNTSAAIAAIAGGKCQFRHDPSADADFVQFVLPPTVGADFDLYVKKGSSPTLTSYDCRPYLGGSSTETCEALVDDATPIFVTVQRFSGSGAFTLSAQSVVVPTLQPGDVVTGTVAQGAMAYYKVVVPQANEAGEAPKGLAVLLAGDMSAFACGNADANVPGTCATANSVDNEACAVAHSLNPHTCRDAGVGDARIPRTDADLYVRHAKGLPTTTVYDCRGYSTGSV